MTTTYRITEKGAADAEYILDQYLKTDRSVEEIAADRGLDADEARILIFMQANGGEVVMDWDDDEDE